MRARLCNGLVLKVASILVATVLSAAAQTNFVLYTFAPTKSTSGIFTNSDGFNPNGWLSSSGTVLYGTAQQGGVKGYGTIFAVNTNGNLLWVNSLDANGTGKGNSPPPLGTPNGGLVISNGTLYGTTSFGGAYTNGAIYSISTNGTSIKTLYSFSGLDDLTGTNSDGADPGAGLIRSGTIFFGTTSGGGNGGNGVVFSFSGTTLTNLHSFSVGNGYIYPSLTNNDGANPSCQLLLLGTNIYGTTPAGGTNGLGTIFRVSTNGSSFTVLHHFDNVGASPKSGLVYADGKLFGMGGSVVFALGTNGDGFTILHQFDDVVDNGSPASSGLTISNGILYGATPGLGEYGYGQVFSLRTNGTGFTSFHDFTALSPSGYPVQARTNFDGAYPNGGLVLINGTLFGAASLGGTSANGYFSSGVLFQASPPMPALMAQTQPFDRNLYLSFQTFEGRSYILQQNDDLTTTNWVNITQFIGDGSIVQFIVPMSGLGQMFFRLVPSDGTPLPPPVIPLFAHSDSQGFNLNFQTLAGLNYTIQQCTNLADNSWSDLTAFTGDGTLMQLSIPMTNSDQVFFRVRQP